MSSSPLRKLKDSALHKAVLMFARPKFERYGELRWLKIDTSDKVLSAELLLKGETEPVIISQARYRLATEGKQNLLVVYDIRISKEWAQNLLDDRFGEFPIKIPAFVRSLLS